MRYQPIRVGPRRPTPAHGSTSTSTPEMTAATNIENPLLKTSFLPPSLSTSCLHAREGSVNEA